MSTDAAATATTTTNSIPVEVFRNVLLSILDEAYVGTANSWTLFTDKGTSIFETLSTIDAVTASTVFSDRASNIAAQVNHVRFHLDVLSDGLKNGWGTSADWPGSWKIGEVSEEQWQDLVNRLRAAYEETRAVAASWNDWNEDFVSGAFSIVAHAAYHLGEIRLSLAALNVPVAPDVAS
ncbi:MAG TPA: hypothetical protein VFQ54_00370 [Thermomicrobiales bacterium]|nr:hypothetical protein [Thermomicrobiales bacterium]